MRWRRRRRSRQGRGGGSQRCDGLTGKWKWGFLFSAPSVFSFRSAAFIARQAAGGRRQATQMGGCSPGPCLTGDMGPERGHRPASSTSRPRGSTARDSAVGTREGWLRNLRSPQRRRRGRQRPEGARDVTPAGAASNYSNGRSMQRTRGASSGRAMITIHT